MIKALPDNETDFLRLIEEIDNELKNQGVPIHFRPLRAIRTASMKLQTSIFIPSGPPLSGVYTGDNLRGHIEAWYERRYGDRLKMGLSPGNVAVLIRGDPWKIKLPLVYGAFKFACYPFPEIDEKIPPNNSQTVNPLRCIEGFTPELSRCLSEEERRKIAHFFAFALQATRRLLDVQNELLIPQARANLETAVSNLFLIHPSYGESKWASLQFAEKLFKSFLSLKGVTFPDKGKKGHDLAILARLCADNGLQGLKPGIVEYIQCDSGVRYGEIRIDLSEAIRAHHDSLGICNIMCLAIGRLGSTASANRQSE